MEYKGYMGIIEVDEERGTLYGRVIGLRDLITFEGRTVEEAVREFQTSVDVYLEWCLERGEEPERPYSGKFLVRIDPGLHRDLALAAERRGLSMAAVVASAIERELAAAEPGAGRPAARDPAQAKA